MLLPIPMRPLLLTLLVLSALAVLTGCLPVQREVVWAQMGTPGRIIDDRPITILVPDGNNGWQTGTASLQGMVAIDEPTLEFYRAMEKNQ